MICNTKTTALQIYKHTKLVYINTYIIHTYMHACIHTHAYIHTYIHTYRAMERLSWGTLHGAFHAFVEAVFMGGDDKEAAQRKASRARAR